MYIVLNEHVPLLSLQMAKYLKPSDSNIPNTHHSAEGLTTCPSLGPGYGLLGEIRSLPAGGEVILDLVIGVVIC